MQLVNKVQEEILLVFGDILESQEFYLTGGTALAVFYLKHRKSNDLDFFTTSVELILPFSHRLEEQLKTRQMSAKRLRGVHSFVELLVEKGEQNTIIHLAQDTPFRLEPVKEFPEYPHLKIDSLPDIASNKLLALFSRATLRDFIDVYFLIKKAGFSSKELMDKARKKDPGFDLYWLGVAFERIKTFKNDSPEMLLLVEPVNFQDLLAFFNQWREEIGKQLR